MLLYISTGDFTVKKKTGDLIYLHTKVITKLLYYSAIKVVNTLYKYYKDKYRGHIQTFSYVL